MLQIKKRDGRIVQFNPVKIENAVQKAFVAVDGGLTEYANTKSAAIANYIEGVLTEHPDKIYTVEQIQDIVVHGLMNLKNKAYADAYIEYRARRTQARKNTTDDTVLKIINGTSDYWKNENSNKDAQIASTQRDYMAGAVSVDISNRLLLPPEVVKAHQAGMIHFHDEDYFAQTIHNCDLVNLEDMLQNGTVINKTLIEKPHSFVTACNIATQIMAQVASGQYGGQTISLAHLAPFVEESRKRIREELEADMSDIICEGSLYDSKGFEQAVERRVAKEITKGVQVLQYQINTLNTSNGQTPFVSLFMYLNEAHSELEKADLALVIKEVLTQRIQGTKNEKGIWVTPAFPKLLYVLEDDNCEENTDYWWLTELAAKCTAKRMVPDYISEKIMFELKGDCYACMGCRSFLTPDRTRNGYNNVANAISYNGKPKYYGRFNQGVVTINLPDVALTAKTENRDFFELLNERLELCHKALKCRHERLKGTLSNISPIHWQYGALARLEKNEPIDKLLFNGYSTISLGFAGLWECVYAATGKKLTEDEGKEFGLKVMQALNDACNKWKAEENIDYSLYGTPLESTTYKFAKCLKNRFGEIEGVSDKNYITNSYHIHVTEKIDAFSKLKFESEFQKLSPGGAISYIECANLTGNIPAVLEVIKFIYNNIMYAELNTKSDYCQVCGWDGEIQIVEENDKLIWECPNCKNRDQGKMNVARRTCGYIGANFWNQGRTQEIKERELHL